MNIERLRNDDGEGSENVTIKMYSRFPIRFHVYSNSSKFPGVECLGDCIQVWKERAKFVVVSLLPSNNTPYKRNFPWCSCREGKKMYQKRVLHVQIISHETYRFFDVLVAIAVIVAKASTKTIRDRGPFLESPGNFTDPKSNIQIEI